MSVQQRYLSYCNWITDGTKLYYESEKEREGERKQITLLKIGKEAIEKICTYILLVKWG